ncbi:MAG: (E)-4-hydroxy-3-methylbut-2-enyl-diphosphate synthase [Treponema sp.]|nr:(E)-4-hydroxy-3-methylbut-2-enyl-diphosphate synthase [Treponema sp.]
MSSRILQVGGFDHVKAVVIGGGHPVVVQTMWKDRLSFDAVRGEPGKALVHRIETLEAMGCGLLRFAVPSMEDAEVLGELASRVLLPLCADIHFDYKIALRCLDFPIAKIRINPGNIGGREKVRQVLEKASEKGIPIRIGVNAGSLPVELRKSAGIFSRKGAKDAEEYKGISAAELMVEAAMRELAVFDEFGFKHFLVSMKASSVAGTIQANRLFRSRSNVPLHIGVTEAGPLVSGTVKNTAALLPLLAEGIGDTIRVSLSDTVENEVIAGREILNAARDMAVLNRDTAESTQHTTVTPDRLGRGVTIVSCPRCGRNGFDTIAFTERWKTRLYSINKDCAIAIMGCAVNGPEEAKHADLGITGAGNSIIIFRNGKIIKTLLVNNDEEIDKAFGEELQKLCIHAD